ARKALHDGLASGSAVEQRAAIRGLLPMSQQWTAADVKAIGDHLTPPVLREVNGAIAEGKLDIAKTKIPADRDKTIKDVWMAGLDTTLKKAHEQAGEYDKVKARFDDPKLSPADRAAAYKQLSEMRSTRANAVEAMMAIGGVDELKKNQQAYGLYV